MGFKSSMIIINKPAGEIDEAALLPALGFGNYSYAEDTTLEDCIYPRDKSVSFGRYNDSLIICEDYLLTEVLETNGAPEALAEYEKILTGLFPGSEVLTVACHSATNWHLYALAKDGERIRFKSISADTPVTEWGDRLEEEIAVYAHSKLIGGKLLFKSSWKDDEVYDNTEDQMMEDFAFGVAKRHLGVNISTGEDEELMSDTPFRKYTKPKRPAQPTAVKAAAPESIDAEPGASEAEPHASPDMPAGKTVRPKPWWKFW
ncbi:hypothetical protein [Puia dinghuensis]|uniref:Uncharacterized protein n=1 Tax=Puia dinghuensis TaxID=1792502 RepID=A0A8J2UHT5_9BACT|nr:hypothetical protein [Puia dinghuensis]GGB19729.1 hypothetical protein GCM10011511_49330 [Puia dinghuensis]